MFLNTRYCLSWQKETLNISQAWGVSDDWWGTETFRPTSAEEHFPALQLFGGGARGRKTLTWLYLAKMFWFTSEKHSGQAILMIVLSIRKSFSCAARCGTKLLSIKIKLSSIAQAYVTTKRVRISCPYSWAIRDPYLMMWRSVRLMEIPAQTTHHLPQIWFFYVLYYFAYQLHIIRMVTFKWHAHLSNLCVSNNRNVLLMNTRNHIDLVNRFLLSSISTRRKYRIDKNYWLPVFYGFIWFRSPWTRFDCF